MVALNNKTTYGYLLGDDVQVHLKKRTVTRIYSPDKYHRCPVRTLVLGSTSMRLLAYLLEHADTGVVCYADVLVNVWENQGLTPSYKRLSQVMIELRRKLSLLGLPDDFIRTCRGKGYRIGGIRIARLYFLKSDVGTRSCVTPPGAEVLGNVTAPRMAR